MKTISLDQVFYRYSKPAKDDFGFIPDKASALRGATMETTNT